MCSPDAVHEVLIRYEVVQEGLGSEAIGRLHMRQEGGCLLGRGVSEGREVLQAAVGGHGQRRCVTPAAGC